ncbi:MarR family transcriptional regulator [Actinoplanes sp. TBRC 11911]|uniref:MarR family winged helix-turn-helix transcriptional regulator n=1 Tax=Actinoplanes sp. TBRC 11911 TaxID=2729386 RepID=UPI00145DCEDB|nr:MarR family transcriptional regulator [Actinoplanes sp. TBRC 11911]NMO57366.1 MarR family transcriptional regulator [Actinoplanes sp. TBRC 11911]
MVLVERWYELRFRHDEVVSHLEWQLHKLHGLSLSDFDILDRLRLREPGSCHMRQLVSHHVSESAVSRAVARLQERGFVERSLHPDDRRRVYVELTDAGRERHAEASATHLAVLAEHLG